MCKTVARCEAKAGCQNPVWSHNRTVRDRNTKIAKIMCICTYHFEKITGAK